MNIRKGYKFFNYDFTCDPAGQPFQYEVGKTYEIKESPIICKRGFHYCLTMAQCFNFLSYNDIDELEDYHRFAEVEALGEIDYDEEYEDCEDLSIIPKLCTNKIKIVRELDFREVLQLVNIGGLNNGIKNVGWNNVGFFNYGDKNNGDCNYGFSNKGCNNFGDLNRGNRNFGNNNVGYYNFGMYNDGDYNCGDFNKTNGAFGMFNTEEHKIMMFNKPTDWTLSKWHNSYERIILSTFNRENPQKWWDGLLPTTRAAITTLPNFDFEIFKQITKIELPYIFSPQEDCEEESNSED